MSSAESTNEPYQKLTANNRGPVIIVAAYIFLITTVLAVVVKIWTRLTTTRKLALTDYAIIAGTVRLFYHVDEHLSNADR